MVELFNKIPITVQVILLVTFVLVCILAMSYLILAIRDVIEERRRDLERNRHEKQKLYDAILRIAMACERIGDIMATTEILSTVEVTEERIIPYD